MSNQYILQRSEHSPNGWVLTDVVNQVVVRFEAHRFNETQRVTPLEPEQWLGQFGGDADRAAKAMAAIVSNMADWLYWHHYDVAMPVPAYIWQRSEDDERLYVVRCKEPRWRLEVDSFENNQQLASSLRICAEWLTRGGGR